MSVLDRMLRTYVTPVLADAGFVKKGRTYRLTAATNDAAMVNIQRSGGGVGDRVVFFVNLSVVVVPHSDWLDYTLGITEATERSYAGGLWQSRLDAPASVAADDFSWGSERWLLDGAEMVPECGELLAGLLRDRAIPLLVKLLDRDTFLALSRDPKRPLGPRVGPADIMLLVDRGPSVELEAAIAECEALDAETYPMAGKLAAWARQRARMTDQRPGNR